MTLNEFNAYIPMVQVLLVPALGYVARKLSSIDNHLATLNGRMKEVEVRGSDAEKLAAVSQAATTREFDQIHRQISRPPAGKERQ